MSSRGTYIEGRHVFLDDAHGWPMHIPVTRIPELLGVAKNSDLGRARFALRWFGRDALQGAYDLLPLCGFCKDAPGFNDMGDDRLACDACCSAAAGSKYDDTTEDYR